MIGLDAKERELAKKRLKRAQVLWYFADLPPCPIGMEACAGPHAWARQLRALGREVRLIPPQYVKAYVRGNKNDYNDARAFAEAVRRPGMRWVAIKTVAEQALQPVAQRRWPNAHGAAQPVAGSAGEIRDRAAQGRGCAARSRCPAIARRGGHIAFYARLIEQQARADEAERRLQTVPGFGPVTANAFHAAVGDGRAYRRGRDVSASLGLVPRQHSNGGKAVLLEISKRGDGYLRGLLVHTARTVLHCAKPKAYRKDDPFSHWAVQGQGRAGHEQGGGSAGQKARVHRLGGTAPPHGLSAGLRCLASRARGRLTTQGLTIAKAL